MAKNNSTTANTQGNKKAGKTYNFFIQVLTIVAVLFVSKIIESFIPFPMPASVIGLVLLRQVEGVGTALTNNIGFLFVPAGVSVINSLPLLSQHPILIILLIIISTLLLLVSVGYVSQLFVTKTLFPTEEQNEKTRLKEEN